MRKLKIKNLDIKSSPISTRREKFVIAKENSINKAYLRLLFEKYYISFMVNIMSQPKVPLKLGQNRYFP